MIFIPMVPGEFTYRAPQLLQLSSERHLFKGKVYVPVFVGRVRSTARAMPPGRGLHFLVLRVSDYHAAFILSAAAPGASPAPMWPCKRPTSARLTPLYLHRRSSRAYRLAARPTFPRIEGIHSTSRMSHARISSSSPRNSSTAWSPAFPQPVFSVPSSCRFLPLPVSRPVCLKPFHSRLVPTLVAVLPVRPAPVRVPGRVKLLTASPADVWCIIAVFDPGPDSRGVSLVFPPPAGMAGNHRDAGCYIVIAVQSGALAPAAHDGAHVRFSFCGTISHSGVWVRDRYRLPSWAMVEKYPVFRSITSWDPVCFSFCPGLLFSTASLNVTLSPPPAAGNTPPRRRVVLAPVLQTCRVSPIAIPGPWPRGAQSLPARPWSYTL